MSKTESHNNLFVGLFRLNQFQRCFCFCHAASEDNTIERQVHCLCVISQHSVFLSHHRQFTLQTHKSKANIVSSALVQSIQQWHSYCTQKRFWKKPFVLYKRPFALRREGCGEKGSRSGIYIQPSGRPPNLLSVTLNKTDLTQHTTLLRPHDGVMMAATLKNINHRNTVTQKFINPEWKFQL